MHEIEALVTTLVDDLRPWLDRPFALYGHSVGALVAFELARRLRRDDGVLPARLFVAAMSAPQLPRDQEQRHRLPDREFVDELRRLGGTPEEMLRDDRLLQVLLPAIKADFALSERYVYRAEPALECPISGFGGLHDPQVSPHELAGWEHHTRSDFRLRMLPRDHFFVEAPPVALVRALQRDLQRHC